MEGGVEWKSRTFHVNAAYEPIERRLAEFLNRMNAIDFKIVHDAPMRHLIIIYKVPQE
jgi:hypothetical protein